VRQHLNTGQGEVDSDAFFRALRDIYFDGILTARVFAWEDKPVRSSRFSARRFSAASIGAGAGSGSKRSYAAIRAGIPLAMSRSVFGSRRRRSERFAYGAS